MIHPSQPGWYPRLTRLLCTLLLCLCGPLGLAAPAPTLACQQAEAGMRTYLQGASANEQPFGRIQLRVVQLGCAHLEEFDDPLWFQHTLHLFIGAFLTRQGDWPALISDCQSRWEVSLNCVSRMVQQHIHADLLPAIRQSGCGTATDWRRVGQFIEQAAAQEGRLWAVGAAVYVPMERLSVRLSCLYGP